MAGAPRERLPEATSALVLLTLVSLTVAFAAGHPTADALLRPVFFATLFSFFHRVSRRSSGRLGKPLRLVCGGFLVLTVAFATATVFRTAGDPTGPLTALLLVQLERGSVYLIGIGMVSYGVLLWVPRLLESQEVLRAGYSRARGQLALSERARANLEDHLDDMARLQALGELAAGIAHDLRNPLTVIKASAGSVRRRAKDGRDIDEHLEVLDRAVGKADRTIQALLDLGRPQSHSPRKIALDAALAGTTELVASEARRLGVEFQSELDASPTVFVDPQPLQRAIVNLILNAIQASEPGGVVRAYTRTFRFGPVDCGAIVVEDRGTGLTREQRAMLFQPFYTTKPTGTGLGLLSVRRVVDDAGGRVGLSPRTGGGTRAVLALPLSPSELDSGEQTGAMAPSGTMDAHSSPEVVT